MKCAWELDIEQTGWGCPTSWDGKATDPDGTEWEIYIRFRYGYLSVELDGCAIYGERISDGLDGIIDWDKAKKHVWRALNAHAAGA